MTALRKLLARTEFRLCLVLWAFGYLLVEIGAAAQGRSAGFMLGANVPLLVLGVFLSLILAGLVHRLESRHFLLLWPTVGLAVIVFGALQTFADFALMRTLALTVFPAWREWALSTNPSRVLTIYLLYTWTMALSVALIWSARTSDAAKLNEARAAAFEAAASRAEAAALRLQLNPHFLFNTLNGIASLVVRRRPTQAEEMIGRLADFLRSSLAADPTALIPLKQELATVRAYLHIEEARFGDRMRVVFRVDDDALDVPVPNFVLQPLIENAVKYGVAPSRRGATIEVEAKRENGTLLLSVANSEIDAGRAGGRADRPARIATDGGVGLANTRARIRTAYGESAWVRTEASGAGFRCEIGLPDTGAPAALAYAQ